MPSAASKIVVVLGIGGTIAGVAARADDHVGYQAGQLGPEALVAAVPALVARVREGALVTAVVASLDSCDMEHGVWVTLLEQARAALARPEVAGLVITHGTDTLEETAYFLHRMLSAADKPVVFTAAMRPATALSADGPQNLFDAVTLAATPGAQGVLVVFAGKVYAGVDLRKVHGYRVEAFDAGDAGPIGQMADGQLRRFRPWPDAPLHEAARALPAASSWPVVDIVTSHAGARGEVIDALVRAGARGLVIAGTGNGSVHRALVEAARAAEAAGIVVRRASRCQLGGVVGARPDSLPSAGMLTAPQARIELMLDLIAQTTLSATSILPRVALL